MNINTNVNEIFFNNSYKSKLWIISLLNTIVSFDQQSKAKRLYKLLKKNLLTLRNNNKTNNNFLDYGFGRGSLLLKIPSKHVNIYGCELSLEAIKNMMRLDRIIKRGINIFYINKSEEIFSKIKFDFITCSHVLEHCENDTELF
jgi:2-polyprenyl-3-methyl-5-hydroxy-6-metoxy-1,4-benzoquinol methylase